MRTDKEKAYDWIKLTSGKTREYMSETRTLSIKYIFVYNVMFAVLFTLCRYVVQVNYSSFDMTQIDAKLAQL